MITVRMYHGTCGALMVAMAVSTNPANRIEPYGPVPKGVIP
jgi:hypothetical protein